MSFYACDLGTRYPGTSLSEVLESARLTPAEARAWTTKALEENNDCFEDLVSFEQLETLLTEAGERSLNLANLVRGEILTLMKTKGEEIHYDHWEKEWVIILPSGTISFVEMEDFCVCISDAKFTSTEEEDADDSYFG